jgi:cell division GTPase FtsZ
MAAGKIVILGIGGRGCAALQRLGEAVLPDTAMTMAVSADKRALSSTPADCSILLGESQTGGRSTGGNTTLAAQAVQQVADLLRQAFAGADAVFMVTGLGGGTGIHRYIR